MGKSSDQDPRVAALQLLLGDESDKTKRALIYAAFGDELLIMLNSDRPSRSTLLNMLRTCISDLAKMQKRLDGASPIGREGQYQMAVVARQIENILRRLDLVMRVEGTGR